MPRKKKEANMDGPGPVERQENLPVAAPVPEAPPETSAPSHEGNGEKRRPIFKVGPIATDRNNTVSAAVWGNEYSDRDGHAFTVYSVTVEASWRDANGDWKAGKSFRGSQLYALIYCLQKANEWILDQRNPQSMPF